MISPTASPRQGFSRLQVITALNYPTGGKFQWGVRTYDAATDIERTEIARDETLDADWNDSPFKSTTLTVSAGSVGRP